MLDFSKKSHAASYFQSIIAEEQKYKKKAVFSFSSMCWDNHRKFRTYNYDDDLYILFENKMCLIVNYRFIDELNVLYRKLTAQEYKDYETLFEKDWFNTVNEIYDFRTNKHIRTEICSLNYGCVSEIVLHSLTKEYGKWVNGTIKYVAPTDETFDEIKLIMDNGNSIVLCAADAEMDGYIRVWSEDTIETIQNP